MKFVIIIILFYFSSIVTADCEKDVQQMVDSGRFSEAFHLLSQCGNKDDPEILFALAVLHINTEEDKSKLKKETNLEIFSYLKLAVEKGHNQSRKLLADLLRNGKYKGVPQNKKAALCLWNDKNSTKDYCKCLELISDSNGTPVS